MHCLVEALEVVFLGLEHDGDMVVIGDNLPPLNRSCVLRGPGKVSFTEIKQLRNYIITNQMRIRTGFGSA